MQKNKNCDRGGGYDNLYEYLDQYFTINNLKKKKATPLDDVVCGVSTTQYRRSIASQDVHSSPHSRRTKRNRYANRCNAVMPQ